MALAILVLLVTLFFMGFFSIYKRHFAGSDDDRRRRNPSLSSSSSSAHRQLTQSMASSSSSYASDSQNCTQWKYNVFLSFRGEDTRKTFTSHLYEGLKNRGINTFQDDKRLENGDSIPEELLKAIEESQVALVIFSKNYATSSWCLNELVKIIECKEVKKQIVIPIFYDVDPSDVRHQIKNFAEAFSKHESRYKDDVGGMQKVKRWRTALSAAANLKGYNVHGR
ncbi:TMV resistance protein N-like [Solanum stenotomum]|uniref:TMV resistance protein N-like n=1 Tax=Solanum stenotomum TaxID=172797 RepID=UPI0020D0957C|nr:TMV resistance protein N-like [Solanum stenotomum]